MIQDVLENLGLTGAEIKVYITLLELGNATAGPIIERSGLQNSVVHRTLLTLIDKGLISFIQEGAHRRYHASDPERFYRFIDDKREAFSAILPQLKAKQELHAAQSEASIYKGTRGITEVYNMLVSARADEYLTFGGGKQCADRMGITWWLNIHTKRVANNLPSRQVFDHSVKNQASDIESKKLTKIRYLPEEFASFQETAIVGDYVAISVFTDNAYSFLVRDPIVAQGYRKHFELLWKQAKP